MSTALATVAADVTRARDDIAALLAQVRGSSDPNQLKDAHERVRLAREWAKIQKVAEAMHADILRLDAECLRRIGQLDAVSVLPPAQRTAATFLGELDDHDFESLLTDAKARTALAMVRQHIREIAHAEARDHGRAIGRGEAGGKYASDSIAGRIWEYERQSVDAALATILNNYASKNFTIAQMTDDLIADLGMPGDLDPGIREGLAEVCREAVRAAPALLIAGTKAPRFVTYCRSDVDGGDYVRIPFENATLAEFAQMISDRRRQLQEDRDALQRLEDVRQAIREYAAPTDDLDELPMGALTARAALSHTA